MTAALRANYLSANEWPWKLLGCPEAVASGWIVPIHISISPTNRCDANCPWCSCRGIDRSLEMPADECRDLLREFYLQGTQAVSITGGGEPTLHNGLGEIVEAGVAYGLRCALVTNGLRWVREGVPDYASEFDWLRVSVTDGLDLIGARVLAAGLKDISWGLSYTVTKQMDLARARAFCEFAAQTPALTHVRFVDEILHPDYETMQAAERAVEGITDKALFQYRHNHEPGQHPCYVSRLKPYIDADGSMYPCCGVQYAVHETATLPATMRLCHWTRYADASAFDGSICRRCFYARTNEVLEVQLHALPHREFV